MTGFLAVVDPPWSADAGGGKRGAGEHYELANVHSLAESYYKARDDKGARIWPPLNTREPMLVFMWATAGAMSMRDDADVSQGALVPVVETFMPPDAFVLARLLGLRVCASLIWAKVDDCTEAAEIACDGAGAAGFYGYGALAEAVDERGVFAPPARMGLGQWTRCEHEYLLVCRRGRLTVPDTKSRPRSVIYAPRGAHSEKPERAWEQAIEPIARSSMPGVSGCEFNCRRPRPGWVAFGALDGEDKPLRYAPAVPRAA